MEKYLSSICLILALVFVITNAQENTQTRVVPSLVECYSTPEIFNRENRLPMSINTLIDLIRKVEDDPNYRHDIRELAVALVHRFRQDGIVRATKTTINLDGVLPFSPAGFQFTKHRTLFSKLIPGNAYTFPNETLTVQERCALHFMLSNSIETQVRGDEATVCNQLSQYRAMRIPRSVHPSKSNFVGDIEVLASKKQDKKFQAKFGRMANVEDIEGKDDPEDYDDNDNDVLNTDINSHIADVDVGSNMLSQCPVENGVIYTPWGSISAGTLMAGIAAGLQPQRVQMRDLIPTQVTGEYRARQTVSRSVDNRWAATLAGDLGEVTLLQGGTDAVHSVGCSGAWKSKVVPKWYLLSQHSKLEMTDAEIRGGIDGFVIANNIQEWRGKSSTLKLSQVLEMYYSQRGVFSSKMKSCNRRDLYSENVKIEIMKEQTIAFSHVLEKEMQMQYTLNSEAITKFSENSVEALSRYIPQSLNDLPCEALQRSPNEDIIWRTASDLYIFVDTTWPFIDAEPILTYLLNGIDVNRFGTNVTILDAQEGNVIVNTTNDKTLFYNSFNRSNYETRSQGFNFPTVLKKLKEFMNNLMNDEKQRSITGGRSKIALIMPMTAGVSDGDSNYAVEQLQIFSEIIPDLRLVFFAGGSPTRFRRFVKEETDLYPMRQVGSGSTSSSSVQSMVEPVISRIQQEPRRIINHRCGSDYSNSDTGSNSFDQYIDAKGLIYYRLHPNYYFGKNDNRKLKIQSYGYGSISVCYSWGTANPRANSTNQDNISCRQITTETIEIDVSNVCKNYYTISSCPILYVTVEGNKNSESTMMRCSDTNCRFPDDVKFSLKPENLGCYSSASKMGLSIFMVIFSSILLAKM